MDYLLFLFIMNLVLLSRLKLVFKDEGAATGEVIRIMLIPLAGLLFLQINTGWVILLLYLLISLLPVIAVEHRPDHRLNRNRALTLGMHLIAIAAISGLLDAGPLASDARQLAERFLLADTPISEAGVLHAQLLAFGVLMIINEMNIVLRYLLVLFGLEPLSEEGQHIDRREYNTGRVIGMLERLFVFIFILCNQYGAVGIILGTKGIARFPDFKNRAFAEYVLIGTFISTLLAMLMAFVVRAGLGF